MNWKTATSVEDLKLIGSFNEVRRNVRETLESISKSSPLQLTCKVRGWAQLLDTIVEYRKLEGAISPNKDPYFRSEAHRYIFALLEMEGPTRMEILGLTRSHYSDLKRAKNWHRKIARLIAPDKCDLPDAEEAFKELEDLYENVTAK